MNFERLPRAILSSAVTAEAETPGAGVDVLIRWWSDHRSDTPVPQAFEAFKRTPQGGWENLATMGTFVFDERDLVAGGGAAACGNLVLVFVTASKRREWGSGAVRLDGTPWFDAAFRPEAWRSWSSEALVRFASRPRRKKRA